MEHYSKVWQRTTKANSLIPGNPEYRTRFLSPLPGEQSNWRKVGVAARYDLKQNTLKSSFRYILQEQKFNNGFRYRLKDNEQIAPIPVGWHQTKLHDYQIVKEVNYPSANVLKSTELQRMPRFYQVKLDMIAEFGANYRPENIFNDSPMSNTKYRTSNVYRPVRK